MPIKKGVTSVFPAGYQRVFLGNSLIWQNFNWNIINGVSPLTLINSLAKPIKSLTQYGLCIQSGTPTPDNPVSILCNNGALGMVDDELPAAYKRVLGFQCANNAMWQITGFKLRGSDTVRISFSVTQACNVFGCYHGTDVNDNYDLYVSTTAGSKYLGYGNGTYLSYWSSADLGERFDVVFTPNGTSGMPQESTWTEKTFESANDMLIGSTTTTGTSSKLRGKLYGNIVVDGRLKLIPCERLSDNVLGYYDTFSETFYEPYTGFTGAVSLGYDGSHYSLAVVGTPEVLTVSGANLLDPSPVTDDNKYIHSQNGSPSSPSATGGVFRYSGFIPVQEGVKYYFGMIPYTASAAGLAWYADTTVASYISGVSGSTLRNINNMKATAPEGAQYLRFGWRIDEGYDTDWEHSVYLCECDSKPIISAWQAYATPQTVNDVPMLLSVGDYKDEAEIISGIKAGKVGIHVFDGTESFGKSSAYGAAFYIQSAASAWGAQKEIVMCSHFLGRPRTDSAQSDNTCFFNSSGHFYFRVSDNSDAAAFKVWLAAQYAAGTPVILLYPLATETTEQTTPHELHSYAGDTTVSWTAEVAGTEKTVEYAQSETASNKVGAAIVGTAKVA